MAVGHTNGVLSVAPGQTSKTQKSSHSRPAGPKLKVVIRRLAPALTEAEFKSIIGAEWQLGGGKVDWLSYKPGKDSKDLAKVSRPSRAYLHLNNEAHLIQLSNHVRQLTFEDAANTCTSSCLLGPPSVEYAPYGRIPTGKRRTDARQGTIDQDPEFMDFLESLINPVMAKEEDAGSAGKTEKVTTTPLVQYLKDKKASKSNKESSSKGKSGREQASSGKGKSKETTEESPKKGGRESKRDRGDKGPREQVKVMSREAANKQGASSSQAVAPAEPSKNPRLAARERGSMAAAQRILQRDGLLPGGNTGGRRGKVEADLAKTGTPVASVQQCGRAGQSGREGGGRNRGRNNNAQQAENDKPKEAPAPMVLLKKPAESNARASTPGSGGVHPRPSTPARGQNANQQVPNLPPTAPAGPVALNKQATPAGGRKQQNLMTPSSGATRAFIKHANPSQGVTEPLLKEAMETFGAVSHVEIDKRKGFAYVEFVDAESLKKAMAANPTKIAQGTVQVLERKDTKPAREALAAPRGPMGGNQNQGRQGGQATASNQNTPGLSGGNAGGGGGGGSGGGRGGPRRGRGPRNPAGGGGGGGGNRNAGSGQANASTNAPPTGPAAVLK